MKCPVHDCDLVPSSTRWGTRFSCEADGCTVACWDRETSTPADADTRQLRHQCHTLFDSLWGPGRRFRSRNAAYRWLRKFMKVSQDKNHIGMFDRAQCRKLIAHLTPDEHRFAPLDSSWFVG